MAVYKSKKLYVNLYNTKSWYFKTFRRYYSDLHCKCKLFSTDKSLGKILELTYCLDTGYQTKNVRGSDSMLFTEKIKKNQT